jgi:acyl-CoA synthetase (AMP-forming)/AMP-acid ligase II
MVPAMSYLLDRQPAAHDRVLGRGLRAFGDRTALVTSDEQITYRDLADRVERLAARLGTVRRLVLITGENTVDTVVAYLAALTGGHVALLAPANAAPTLTAAYDPDVVIGAGYAERRVGSTHRLHPELALLLSTSGSTGSPKLVRLSHANLTANAASIATYLDIRDTDRGATTLPLHYSYGLSVLNSHLYRGAGVILTGHSVVDPCFWDLFRRAGGTGLAGVPHTFTLLDRVGFDAMRLPRLRYVTQAGGRLPADRVRHYAELGRRRGWDFYVMYGQTEATARIAYLPPERATTHPAAIGVAVPGGQLRLEPFDGAPDGDAGELVYRGPNVMLGYAERPADLALGRTVHELRTGDIARRTPEGLFELLGRRSRFVKVFGLRIDLHRVESALEADGLTACCATRDDLLAVAVQGPADAAAVARRVAAQCALPARAVRVVVVDELPRLPSGKVDQQAVAALAVPAAAPGPEPGPGPAADIAAVYAEVLDRADVTDDDSFVGLGGDSLSYVEASVRLEQLLGRLPADWHTRPIRELRRRPADRPGVPAPPRPGRRRLDTSVALRAVAIVLVVGTHIGVFTIRGGAHVLLILAGWNFARFHLTDVDRRRRVRHVATSVARIAVPSAVLIALAMLVGGRYSWQNILLLNEAFGPRVGTQRYFWFVETLVYLLLAVLAVDRWERRLPFGVPAALLGLGLTVRYGILPVSPTDHLGTPATLFWLFALGWAAAKASRAVQRWAVTVLGVVAVFGFFDTSRRDAVVIAGLVLLFQVPTLPSAAWLNRVAGVLAGSSLYIYLTHWQVYPHLENHSRPLALLAALLVGVLTGAAVDRVAARLPWRRLASRTSATPTVATKVSLC